MNHRWIKHLPEKATYNVFCAFAQKRCTQTAWIRYSPLYIFPPCNHERSHTDSHNGADALALRVHQKDKHVYTTNHDTRNQTSANKQTWIQKRIANRPLEVHSPETQHCWNHLAVNRIMILPSLELGSTKPHWTIQSQWSVLSALSYLVANVPNKRNQEACHSETERIEIWKALFLLFLFVFLTYYSKRRLNSIESRTLRESSMD